MKVPTGLKKLDKLLGGGLPDKTVTLISGGPGAGKTLLSLNFLLDGARNKERCCYVSLSESKEELIRACKEIAALKDIEKYLGNNLAIEHINLSESITLKKFIDIIASYPRIDRLVIDNVNKLLMFSDNSKSYRISMSELVKNLRSVGCSLVLCETKEEDIDSGNNEAFECDGVFQLSFMGLEEKPMRTITLHKLRYSSFEPKMPREFVIDKKGLRLGTIDII